MDKNAKELIEKLARASRAKHPRRPANATFPGNRDGTPLRPGQALAADALWYGPPAAAAAALGYGAYKAHKHLKKKLEDKDPEENKMNKDASALIQKLAAGGQVTNLRNPQGPTPGALELRKKKKLPEVAALGVKKESSMKAIIDDIIKGAEQNSFGRPVQIQADTEWTPLDTAKTAGALQFLGEQGYSVKQAAEYLGLTEDQVQFILKAVG